jgi:hypothetical protein
VSTYGDDGDSDDGDEEEEGELFSESVMMESADTSESSPRNIVTNGGTWKIR